MADKNSNQYQQAFVDEPKSQILPQFRDGRIRRLYAEIDPTAEFAVGEKFIVMELPQNAVPLEARIVSPDLSGGAGGLLDLGWAAGAEGVEAASADGLIANIATDGGAIDSVMGFSAAGYNKRFGEPVNIEGVFSVAATTAASGKTIQVEVRYVID